MLVLRIPDVSFPTDRPLLARYYAADPFPADGALPAPWVTWTAGGAPVPSVSGGSLRVKADTAAAVAHAWRTVTVPSAWHYEVGLTASTATLIGGADDGRLGLTLQPESGGAGLHAGVFRTGLPNGSYFVFSTWGATGAVVQTGPNGPSRITDMTKAPQVGHRFGLRLSGGSLYLTADGVNVATLPAPAWVTAGGRIRFGVAATYGADSRIDDWQVTA